MSKTNHRINKDREGRAPESKAHKSRREAKRLADHLAEVFEEVEDDLDLFYDEYEPYEKIGKRK